MEYYGSAFNYDFFGTANKRATFHCEMHKARVLACGYYFNMLYRKFGLDKRFEYNMPDTWANQIVNSGEIEMLKKLAEKE